MTKVTISLEQICPSNVAVQQVPAAPILQEVAHVSRTDRRDLMLRSNLWYAYQFYAFYFIILPSVMHHDLQMTLYICTSFMFLIHDFFSFLKFLWTVKFMIIGANKDGPSLEEVNMLWILRIVGIWIHTITVDHSNCAAILSTCRQLYMCRILYASSHIYSTHMLVINYWVMS